MVEIYIKIFEERVLSLMKFHFQSAIQSSLPKHFKRKGKKRPVHVPFSEPAFAASFSTV